MEAAELVLKLPQIISSTALRHLCIARAPLHMFVAKEIELG